MIDSKRAIETPAGRVQAAEIGVRFSPAKSHLSGAIGGLMHVVIQRYRVRLGVVAEAARYADKCRSGTRDCGDP